MRSVQRRSLIGGLNGNDNPTTWARGSRDKTHASKNRYCTHLLDSDMHFSFQDYKEPYLLESCMLPIIWCFASLDRGLYWTLVKHTAPRLLRAPPPNSRRIESLLYGLQSQN